MLNFFVTFGVVAGYGHDNEGVPASQEAEKIVAVAWRQALDAEFASSGILVGATVSAGRVVYPGDFGCPDEGEVVVMVRGDANPKFVGGPDQPSYEEFRGAVIRVAEAVKNSLQQERVQLAFASNSGFVYYEPDETGGRQRFGDC